MIIIVLCCWFKLIYDTIYLKRGVEMWFLLTNLFDLSSIISSGGILVDFLKQLT